MRTTVTLDEDVLREVRRLMQTQGKTFKDALNDSLRLHFAARRNGASKPKQFKVRAHDMKLRRGIDPSRLSDQLDAMDTDAFLQTARRKSK